MTVRTGADGGNVCAGASAAAASSTSGHGAWRGNRGQWRSGRLIETFRRIAGAAIIPSRTVRVRSPKSCARAGRPRIIRGMNAELFSATVLLILVIDPFGNVPLVVSALKNVPPERHVRVVLRECAAAYVILVGFMLGGRTFLQWLHLSEESLNIAGGIILFLIAIRMVFPRPEGIFGDPPGAEPFLVPLAIPAIAGPSALATVMLMASRDPARIGSWLLALTVAMGATTVLLALADRLQRWLGERAVLALRAADGAGADRARGGDAAVRRAELRRRARQIARPGVTCGIHARRANDRKRPLHRAADKPGRSSRRHEPAVVALRGAGFLQLADQQLGQPGRRQPEEAAR